MSGFGQFSQEAYDQLRQAYADSLTQAENVEKEGIKIGENTLGLETAPFKADWLDKTGVWRYPSGRGDYQDARQSPEDLMAALRDENGEIKSSSSDVGDEEEDVDLESMTDEEIDSFVDQLLAEMEAEDDQEDGEDEDENEDEDEDVDLSDLSDEELLELAKEVLADEDEEEETPDEEEEEDLISVADKIAALKEELAALSANLTLEGDEEEAEDEEEEPTETDSDEDPIEEEEEVDSDAN